MSTRTVPVPIVDGLIRLDPPALLASRCRRCGSLRFPAGLTCADCQSDEVETSELSTTGVLYTFAIVRAAPPGYLGAIPYAVGVVELPEDIRITSTIVADDLDDLEIGDRVELELTTLAEHEPPLVSFAYRVSS